MFPKEIQFLILNKLDPKNLLKCLDIFPIEIQVEITKKYKKYFEPYERQPIWHRGIKLEFYPKMKYFSQYPRDLLENYLIISLIENPDPKNYFSLFYDIKGNKFTNQTWLRPSNEIDKFIYIKWTLPFTQDQINLMRKMRSCLYVDEIAFYQHISSQLQEDWFLEKFISLNYTDS